MDKNFWGMQDPAKDTYTQRFGGDSRKPKLTLATLNKLKKIRANRKLNVMARRETMQSMYGAPDESSGM
jgi:hypothetical protein